MDTEIFSPAETRVLDVLGRKSMMIEDIVKKIYTEPNQTMYPHETIAGIVRRINTKCDFHKLPWFLNAMGGGRGGKTVWRDKR